MFKRATEIFAPPNFPADEEKSRSAELLNTILWSMTLLTAVSLIALLLGGTGLIATYYVVAAFTLILLFLHIPLRRGYTRAVSYTLTILFTLVLSFAIYSGGTIRAPGVVLYTLTIILSGLTINRQAAYWVAGINILIFLTILVLEINGFLPDPVLTVNIQQAIIFSMATIMVAALLGIALRRLNESLDRARASEERLANINIELEQRVNERTAELSESTKQIQKRASQLEAVANVARATAAAQNLESLLASITEETSSHLGYYHVGIFLLDANKEFAILRAANSEGGKTMLARGHRLQVGQQGIVGFVAFRGQPRVALNVGDEAVYFNNPDLPNTQSEVALPLKFGSEIIGALDIQSTETNAFTQDDVEAFTILADQVAVAIQNAQSLEQAERAVREAEVASSQLTRQVWDEYGETIATKGYRYDGIKPEPLKSDTRRKSESGLLVPVQLRGQTIGRLRLKTLDETRQLSEDEMAVIQSTADRMALALESARLLDDAQKRAARETFLSTVAAKLGTSFQLDSILRDTVEELGQTLKGSTVTFQLINPSERSNTDSDGE